MRAIQKYASLVVFAHTVFALPFALIAFTMACLEAPPARLWMLLLQVLGCMVTARNSAMSFNRYADRFIDAQNKRTLNRELPSGKLSPQAVVIFFGVNVLLFLLCCWSINTICLWLAFPALALLCGYSYTKRFTWLCHLVLGLCLAMAPIGAYIAVTGAVAPSLFWLSGLVVLWVSGFDILYSLPDEQHDRDHSLHSVPQRFGAKGAFIVSGGLHGLTLSAMVLYGLSASLGILYWVAVVLFTALLLYQHAIISPRDLSKLNRAFFTTNGVASVLFAMLTIMALLL